MKIFQFCTLHNSIGPLYAVSNINYIFVNSTLLNITWSAPHTLDGVGILGYNITITNTSNGNILHTYFTQDTWCTINNDIIDGEFCVDLTLSISGYNRAGDGTATTSDFYFPKGNYQFVYLYISNTHCKK